jgi:hypothetical protein
MKVISGHGIKNESSNQGEIEIRLSADFLAATLLCF